MCRGFSDYECHIKETASRYNVSDRVYYLHDEDLVLLMKKAKGVITINSTVGISSMHHDTAVKTLGRCFFDRTGLASQQHLSDFFSNPVKPDRKNYRKMTHYLKNEVMVNGSLYSHFEITSKNIADKICQN